MNNMGEAGSYSAGMTAIEAHAKSGPPLPTGKWHAGVQAEATVKAGDVGAAGSGGTSDLMKKGYSAYVLTDAGVSATATVTLLRAQPYSIE